MISPDCHYKIYWNGGRGTNMRAEIIALWGLLWFATQLYLEELWVFGDSKVIIEHMNKGTQLNPGSLTHWMERIKALKRSFSTITFSHVYREKNNEADRLSKRGLSGRFGEMYYELFNSNGHGAEDCLSHGEMKQISRKPMGGFNLVPHHIVETTEEYAQANMRTLSPSGTKDVLIEYNLSLGRTVNLMLLQRQQNHVDRRDFEICKEHEIDNTGVVCIWPSEEVLTYFCILNADMFRNKRVLELGSGYGLAGLSIAACTDAAEVVISDGNPQVVDYIQKNITANVGSFEDTKVTSLLLRWGQDVVGQLGHNFDLIIAADCTFFKEFHADLAYTLKSLLELCKASQAIFFSPKRGTTLDLFLRAVNSHGLHVKIHENYNSLVWDLHRKFMEHDSCACAWPNYDEEHCYPLLIIISS